MNILLALIEYAIKHLRSKDEIKKTFMETIILPETTTIIQDVWIQISYPTIVILF